MAEVLIAEIDVTKLPKRALMVLRAALIYGFENCEDSRHAVSLADFCQLAGLPTMDENEITPLLENAWKALGMLHLINTEAPNKDDFLYASWQLLEDVGVIGNDIVFQLYRFTYIEVIRTALSSLLLSKSFREIACEY